MKSFKSSLAIILSLMIVFASFPFLGAYAENELVDVEVSAIGGLESFSSYESVVLEWNKATVTKTPYTIESTTDPDTGDVTETKVPGEPIESDAAYTVNGSKVSVTDLGNGKVQYVAKGVEPGEYRSFRVAAYDPASGKTGAAKSKGNSAVRTSAYRIKIKKSGTLKKHGGNGPSTLRVVKGQYYDAYGFGGGKYILNYGGSIFYCNMSRTSKKSTIYTNDFNYSPKEAEFYVNARGISSGTSSLVWVNTFTQHLYVFSGSAGKWKCIHDNECSTGKAKTPSPTGVYGQKMIWKKIPKRHGIKWWSPYSDINSIHSKKAKWKIGTPSSNGCIRNYESDAYFVYYYAPIGTRVVLY